MSRLEDAVGVDAADWESFAIAVVGGAAVAVVLGFVPLLRYPSPVLGGVLAGYACGRDRSSAGAGALVGVVTLAVGGVALLGHLAVGPLGPHPLLGPWTYGLENPWKAPWMLLLLSAVLLVGLGALGGALGGTAFAESTGHDVRED